MAHEVVRECVPVVREGPEALGRLLLGEAERASARLELLDEVADSV